MDENYIFYLKISNPMCIFSQGWADQGYRVMKSLMPGIAVYMCKLEENKVDVFVYFSGVLKNTYILRVMF